MKHHRRRDRRAATHCPAAAHAASRCTPQRGHRRSTFHDADGQTQVTARYATRIRCSRRARGAKRATQATNPRATRNEPTELARDRTQSILIGNDRTSSRTSTRPPSPSSVTRELARLHGLRTATRARRGFVLDEAGTQRTIPALAAERCRRVATKVRRSTPGRAIVAQAFCHHGLRRPSADIAAGSVLADTMSCEAMRAPPPLARTRRDAVDTRMCPDDARSHARQRFHAASLRLAARGNESGAPLMPRKDIAAAPCLLRARSERGTACPLTLAERPYHRCIEALTTRALHVLLVAAFASREPRVVCGLRPSVPCRA